MIIQIGNTGFNAEALADWTREQFMKQYGNLPGAKLAWDTIQKHNRGSKKSESKSSGKKDRKK